MCEKIDYRGRAVTLPTTTGVLLYCKLRVPSSSCSTVPYISEQHLLVLRVLVHEAFLRMRKLPQLVSYHVLGNRHRQVVLSVMHKKTDPNEMRQDSA
jgi:hypothetical protein